MTAKNQGFVHLAVLLLSLLLLLAVVFYLLVVKGLVRNPLAPAQKPTVSLQSQYQNPFDKNTQYANPFSQYKNPFDTVK